MSCEKYLQMSVTKKVEVAVVVAVECREIFGQGRDSTSKLKEQVAV